MALSKLSDSKYHNWIKAGLALIFTKEGIEPFVEDEIQQFQLKCLSDICYSNCLISGTICSGCCTENVVKCPTKTICSKRYGKCNFHRNSATQFKSCTNKICHNFEKEIQNAHRYHGPSYRNTDASQWCSNPWEVAKCFMPPDGYKDKASAAETDFNGIISVIINHSGFQTKIQDDLSKKTSIFEKAREIGRAVRHSPNLEVSDASLKQYFNDLHNLLSDPKHLANDKDALNVQKNLSQLENNTLPIGEEQIRKVFAVAADVVRERIRNESEEENRKHMSELLKKTENDIKVLFESKKTVYFSEIAKSLSEAKDKIKQTVSDFVSEAKDQITVAVSGAKDEVSESLSNAKIDITEITKDEVDRVKQTGDEQVKRLQHVDAEKDYQILKGHKRKTLRDIDEKGNDVVHSIKQAGEEEVKKLKADYKIEEQTLEDRKRKALRDIDEKGNDVINSIQQAGEVEVKKLKRGYEIDEQTLQDLQEDLINHYRDTCNTLLLSPLSDDIVDVPLQGIYVPPFPLVSMEISTKRLIGKEATSQQRNGKTEDIHSLPRIFSKEDVTYRNIYITAEPGFGKSSFANWLLLNWCQARKPIKDDETCFSNGDTEYMRTFDFVFLILLRDMEADDTDVEKMIKKHLMETLARKSQYTTEFLEQVLCSKKCLVILDGLDEWTASSNPKIVPARSSRQTCTYITTSRPWKYEMVLGYSLQIDRHIQIQILGSKERLVTKLIKHFKNRKCLGKHLKEMKDNDIVSTFAEVLTEKKLEKLSNSPVVLMQILYLWNYEGKIGNSKCDIFTDMIELMLTRAEKKETLKHIDKMSSDNSECFKEESECCRKYSWLLVLAGQLAFWALFDENKESSFVFNPKEAKKYLESGSPETCDTDDILDTLTKIGILSKETSKGVRKNTVCFTFYHKMIMEFFAALYIQSKRDDSVTKAIKERCATVSSILEMGNLLVFLSGFSPSVASTLLQDFQSTISDDEEIKCYRSGSTLNLRRVELIQEMVVECVVESKDCGRSAGFPLEDVVISGSKSYSAIRAVISCFHENVGKIKSLHIGDCQRYMTDNGKMLLKTLIQEMSNQFDKSTLEIFPDSQSDKVRLSIDFSRFERLKRIDISLKCLEKLQLNENLQTLHLFTVPLRQLQLNTNLNELSIHNVPLKQLQLNEHLQKLCMSKTEVSQLQTNGDLKKLFINNVPLTELQLNEHLQKLEMSETKVSQLQANEDLKELSIENVPLTVLQLNEHLQKLYMSKTEVSQLQPNEDLKELSIHNVPLTELQLNEHLQKLCMSKTKVSQLQANEDLTELFIKNVPLTELQLNAHLQMLEM